MPDGALHLHEGIGLEIELMLVDRATLDVRPIADRLLREVSGDDGGDYDAGTIGWSNELVLHLLELKMSAPAATLEGVAPQFQANVARIDALLAKSGATLLPGGMHPWMDPAKETVLWPHDYAEVYRAYDRLFDCKRHGWANLQSNHVNLSFAGDEEFGRLHAAVRLVLPLIPALAASSPFVDGRATGILCNRLTAYRTNSSRVPALTGDVIPEPVFSIAEYEQRILAPIEREIAKLEPEGILRGEWLNSRGAIARFDRNAIEIRLVDAQECPAADVGVAWAVACLVRGLCEERWCPSAEQRRFETSALAALLDRTTLRGPQALVENLAYARALGWRGAKSPRAGELWARIVDDIVAPASGTTQALLEPVRWIERNGTLAERLLRAAGRDVRRERLREVYGDLARTLGEGRLFR